MTIENLNRALSVGDFLDPITRKLIDTLDRLNLPKPKHPSNMSYGGVLKVEDLETTLKNVTFDLSKIKLHNNLGKKK